MAESIWVWCHILPPIEGTLLSSFFLPHRLILALQPLSSGIRLILFHTSTLSFQGRLLNVSFRWHGEVEIEVREMPEYFESDIL